MKYFTRSIGILLILSFAVGCNNPNRIVSEGSRVGTVVKFSLKETGANSLTAPGPKSWEGVLNMTIPGSSVMEQWIFSVEPEDTAAVEKVKQAMRSRQTVEVAYRQWLSTPSENRGCSSIPKQGTNYSAYDVLPINEPK